MTSAVSTGRGAARMQT